MMPMGSGLHFLPLAQMVSGVGPSASGIFSTHVSRPQEGAHWSSPPPGGAYHIFSLGYNQDTFSLCIL